MADPPPAGAEPVVYNPAQPTTDSGDYGSGGGDTSYSGNSYMPPQYTTHYNPAPPTPIHPPTPTPPARPIEVTKGWLRAGNLVVGQPAWLPDAYAVSINRWLAALEQRETTFLTSIGVPADDAARKAAATAMGAAIGAGLVGVPASVVGAAGGAVVGGVTAALLVPLLPLGFTAPIQIAIGTGIGAGVGFLGGAALGGTVGGVIGGTIGYLTGAGDPGAHPSTTPSHPAHPHPVAPKHSSGDDQYQLHYHGTPAGIPVNVDYRVHADGGVTTHADAGTWHTRTVSVPAQQATAPYTALGTAGHAIQTAVADTAVTITTAAAAQKIVHGLHVHVPTPHQKTRA